MAVEGGFSARRRSPTDPKANGPEDIKKGSAKRWGMRTESDHTLAGKSQNKSAVSVHQFGNDKQHAQHSRKNNDSDSVVARRDISDFGNFQFIHKPFSQGERQMLKTITASSGGLKRQRDRRLSHTVIGEQPSVISAVRRQSALPDQHSIQSGL
jgi:hypothetical protein